MKKAVNILLFIGLVIASAVFAFWLSNGHSLIFSKPSEQILPKLDEKNFEEVLNNFLKDIDAHADVYRKRRRLPEELLKPANLKTLEYVNENAALFKDAEGKMREEMNALMDVFSKTDDKVNLLIIGKAKEEAGKTRAQWQALKDKQMASYVDFFSFEEDRLAVYEELMALYIANAQKMHYDEASDSIAFDDPAAKTKEVDLRGRLKKIGQDQFALLKKDNLENVPVEAPDVTQAPPVSDAPEIQPTVDAGAAGRR